MFSVGSVLNFLNLATSLRETVNSSSAGSCQAAFLRFVVLIIAFAAGREDSERSESESEEVGKAEMNGWGGGDCDPLAVGASTKNN